MGEFDLIDTYFRRPAKRAALGIGDDCALIPMQFGSTSSVAGELPAAQFWATTTDMLVEGRHFFAGADPYRLGWKCLAVNLSDLAAIGAEPHHFSLAFALPEADPAWLKPFSQGLFALADAHDIELIGGDTTAGPRTICITATGLVPPALALKRSAAKAGDDIWISDEIGGAALQLFTRWGRTQFSAAIPAAQIEHFLVRMEQPQPRVALGIALRGIAHAAIDISDGLSGDLGHILKASKCGAEVRLAQIPAHPYLRGLLATPERNLAVECLLSGGDDYELIFTAPPSARGQIEKILAGLGLAGACIGKIVAGDQLKIFDEDGKRLIAPKSFDHFAP